MIDNCMTYLSIAIIIIILIYNNKKISNKNCVILLILGILIIFLMVLYNQDVEKFKNKNKIEKFKNDNQQSNVQQYDNKQSDNQQSNVQQSNVQQSNVQQSDNKQYNVQQSNNIPLGNSKDDNVFELKNEDYTLNANTNDSKFINNNEVKQSLQAKDLLPGYVTNSKDNFDSFTDLFNYDKALELDIAENKLGIDTIGQSKRNASQDLREAPVCPKFNIGPWNNSTIEPDNNIKSLY